MADLVPMTPDQIQPGQDIVIRPTFTGVVTNVQDRPSWLAVTIDLAGPAGEFTIPVLKSGEGVVIRRVQPRPATGARILHSSGSRWIAIPNDLYLCFEAGGPYAEGSRASLDALLGTGTVTAI